MIEVIEGMSLADYHDDTTSYSRTQVADFIENPATFYARHVERRIAREPKPYLELGTLLHDCFMRPDALSGRDVLLIPPSALSESGSKAGKGWLSFRKDNPGKVLLKEKEYHTYAELRLSILAHKSARWLIESPGHYGTTVRWDDPCGLKLRVQFDKLKALDPKFIVDLKSSSSLKDHAVLSSVRRLGYDLQAAFYQNGADMILGERPTFVFLFALTTSPHTVRTLYLPAEWIDARRRKIARKLIELRDCLDKKLWPVLDAGRIVRLPMPRGILEDE